MKTSNFIPALAIGLTSAVTIGLAAPDAQAASLMTYKLGNHSGAAKADPGYGLRLDGLDGLLEGLGSPSDNVFTFDFDDIASSMSMTYDMDTGEINISGTSIGGVDGGSDYVPGSEVSAAIQFTYFDSDPGAGNILAEVNDTTPGDPNDGADYGYGTLMIDGVELELRAKAAGGNYFNLGNNHRGEPGLSGWGWLEYRLANSSTDTWYNGGTSDWLFTGEKVPEPSMTLGLLAIGGLMMSRRKRSAKA